MLYSMDIPIHMLLQIREISLLERNRTCEYQLLQVRLVIGHHCLKHSIKCMTHSLPSPCQELLTEIHIYNVVTFWPWFHVTWVETSCHLTHPGKKPPSLPPTMNVDILLVIASGDTLEVEWGCVFTTVPSWRRAYMHIECDTSYAVHYQPIESSTHSTCTCTSGGGINNQQKTMRVLIPVLTEFVPSPWAAAEFPPSVHQMTSRDHPSSLL